MEPDGQLLEIFREEANERLDRIVESLLAVEAGSADADVVDSLFRDAHSIKGNAGMVGFDEAQSIAAAMENILEKAREGGSLPPELADSMLHATDAIRRSVAGESGVAEPALAELESSGTDVAQPAKPPEPAKSADVPGNGAGVPPATNGRGHAPESHSIRVDADKVDRMLDAVGETVLHQRRLDHVMKSNAGSEAAQNELDSGSVLIGELQDAVIQMRTLPLSSITGPFPRAVRDIAVAEGKKAELLMTGVETQLDRVILEGISEMITHLLRNSVSHGIEPPEERELAGKPETGRVELRAEQRRGRVAIEVVDDGRGVSPELLEEARKRGSLAEVLAAAGFSTAKEVTEISGRGVGLDAVKAHVESLGGELEMTSEPGRGSTITLLLPLTLALLHLLLVERAGQAFGLPLGSVEEALSLDETLSLGGRTSLDLRGRSIPVADLAEVLGAERGELPPKAPAVIVSASGARLAALCDSLIGEQEVVVKTLGPLLGSVRGYLGAAILGDGRVALILDPNYLARAAPRQSAGTEAAPKPVTAPKVLVVDDEFTVRELQRSILEAAGYRVLTAGSAEEALGAVAADAEVELVVTDIEMPEMDGFELLGAIRGDPEHSTLPVVIVTSRGSDEDRKRGVDTGADAYIVKQDFDQQALLATVQRLIGE